MNHFSDIPLAKELLKNIEKIGYAEPTAVQSNAIMPILHGHDLIVTAPTGTGKTAAFAIPLIQHLINNWNQPRELRVHALILSPTRELANQLYKSVNDLISEINLKTYIIHGGISSEEQVQAARLGIDILIATPGRLIDLMKQKFIKLDETDYIVVDESDRMLDLGFEPNIRRIFNDIPNKRQALFFSATMPSEAKKLAKDILNKPKFIELHQDHLFKKEINHQLFFVEKKNKFALLEWYLNKTKYKKTIIFCRTRRGAERLTSGLNKNGFPVHVLHGNKSQFSRKTILNTFRDEKNSILISTDLASRGIHVDRIMKVINFDLPSEKETFLHRIGRTGRAGYSGDAIHFCDATEKRYLIDIEEYLSFNFQINTDHPYHSDQIKDLKATSISKHNDNNNKRHFNKHKSHQWKLSPTQTKKLHKKNIINSKKK